MCVCISNACLLQRLWVGSRGEIGLEPTGVVLHLMSSKQHPARAQLCSWSPSASQRWHLSCLCFKQKRISDTVSHWPHKCSSLLLMLLNSCGCHTAAGSMHVSLNWEEWCAFYAAGTAVVTAVFIQIVCRDIVILLTWMFFCTTNRSAFAHRFTVSIVKSCCAHASKLSLHLTPPHSGWNFLPRTRLLNTDGYS